MLDPRADLAAAIISTILHRAKWSSDGTAPVFLGSKDVTQALVICIAMLTEADGANRSLAALSEAAETFKSDLIAQLLFMRDHFDQTGVRMWDRVAPPTIWWW